MVFWPKEFGGNITKLQTVAVDIGQHLFQLIGNVFNRDGEVGSAPPADQQNTGSSLYKH
jgi:hypothetical protein